MGGNVQPSLDNAEHVGTATGDNIEAKRVLIYGYDAANSTSRRVAVDSNGNIGSSGSSGTQYTQGGATVANPTGTAEIWFDGSGNPKAVTPSQPLPSNVTDGANIAGVLKSDGTAAGQNALITSGTGYSTATLTLNSGSPATAWFDMLNYASYSVEILTNTTPATLTFQTSGDASQTNIRSALFFDSQTNNSAGVTSTTSTNATFYGGRPGRYFRVSSNNGAGTTTLVITFYTTASPFPFIGGLVTATGNSSPADGFANSSSLIMISPVQYNGTTHDRPRNNVTGVVIAAGATGSNAGVSTTTFNASKAIIVVNISAFTSGSLTVTINGITSSGYTYPILTSTALAAVAVTPLRIFPGGTAAANAVANDMVPRTLQVVTTVTGTLTYGIDYELSV
jgi:hypothetical protein